MKQNIAVVGNREGWSYPDVARCLDNMDITKEATIITGGAEGVDFFAQQYAKSKGLSVMVIYPNPKEPSPKRYFDRNGVIAAMCDFLIAFDKKEGASGTKNTIANVKKEGKAVFLFKNEAEIDQMIKDFKRYG